MSEWKEVNLSDVTSVLGDGIHGTPKYSDNGEYFFINGNNLCEGKIVIKSDTKRVSEDEYLKYRKNLTDRSILFSINGTVGNVAKYNGEPCILGKSACYFNIIDSVDKDYIYYVVSSPSFVKSMSNLANGTTIKNVSLKQMREKKLYLPPLEIQHSIASILSSLDDKIAVNKKICENLEAQAQALFKNWFVDFAPFKDGKFVESELGLIPEGWRVGSLGEIIEFQNGYSFKSSLFVDSGRYKVITIKAVQDGKLVTDGADKINILPSNIPSFCILKPEDILMSLTGNVGRVCLVNQEGLVLNQRVCKLRAKVSKNRGIIYTLIRGKSMKNRMINLAKGTAQANLSPIETSKLPIVIPPQKCIDCIADILNEYLLKLVKCEQESLRLSTLRDTLLPKLMSGEIKVNEIEKSL